MRTTDDIAAALDFNFKPGDRVVPSMAAMVGMSGVIISVDPTGGSCGVMWTLPTGAGVRFQECPCYVLQRDG